MAKRIVVTEVSAKIVGNDVYTIQTDQVIDCAQLTTCSPTSFNV